MIRIHPDKTNRAKTLEANTINHVSLQRTHVTASSAKTVSMERPANNGTVQPDNTVDSTSKDRQATLVNNDVPFEIVIDETNNDHQERSIVLPL